MTRSNTSQLYCDGLRAMCQIAIDTQTEYARASLRNNRKRSWKGTNSAATIVGMNEASSRLGVPPYMSNATRLACTIRPTARFRVVLVRCVQRYATPKPPSNVRSPSNSSLEAARPSPTLLVVANATKVAAAAMCMKAGDSPLMYRTNKGKNRMKRRATTVSNSTGANSNTSFTVTSSNRRSETIWPLAYSSQKMRPPTMSKAMSKLYRWKNAVSGGREDRSLCPTSPERATTTAGKTKIVRHNTPVPAATAKGIQ